MVGIGQRLASVTIVTSEVSREALVSPQNAESEEGRARRDVLRCHGAKIPRRPDDVPDRMPQIPRGGDEALDLLRAERRVANEEEKVEVRARREFPRTVPSQRGEDDSVGAGREDLAGSGEDPRVGLVGARAGLAGSARGDSGGQGLHQFIRRVPT